MTNTDFLNSNSTKNLLLFNLYDVDEFVLRVVEDIKDSNLIDHWDVSRARRYSYEIFSIGKNEYEESEISTEEYLERTKFGDLCFTKLNYKEFEKEFPLDELEFWYGSEWLYDFQYNEAFLQQAIYWIDNISGDASKKLRLRDLLRKLKGSRLALENIKKEKDNNIPLNPIQEKVIQIFIRFDEVMTDGITNRYKSIFPELFYKSNSTNYNPTSLDIINRLIDGELNKNRFESYENKLITQKFLSEDRNQWLFNAADLVRFYNFCERKNMINRAFKNNKKGIELLRQLYNFHQGKGIDSPRSKRLNQEHSKKDIGQYNFLDII